jgi:hypothetical protein
MNCHEYLEQIKELKNKTENLTIKLNDLNIIKIKMQNNEARPHVV